MMADVLASPSPPSCNAVFFGDRAEEERRDQLSLLAILATLFRKSFLAAWKRERGGFSGSGGGKLGMEIGWPTDVQHVIHVTFDRFDGFLGLPVEFELEVPRRAPSASTTVFGVSTESMQLSYDYRGNIIPTILLRMQRHLYFLGGLQAEGIFRITAGNSHEEFVRGQLNRGVVPEDIDVHCLASLIKAWFRELPVGVLDSLSPDHMMRCETEDDCDRLARLLPPTESALLDWVVNLMADVVQEENLNKMNARNIAMVFAPNMTKMADPLTALMYVVQVMNFLKTLIEKTLRERRENTVGFVRFPQKGPSEDDNGNRCFSTLGHDNDTESNEGLCIDNCSLSPVDITDEDDISYSTFTEESDRSVHYETHVESSRSEARSLQVLFNGTTFKIRLLLGNHDRVKPEPAACNAKEVDTKFDTETGEGARKPNLSGSIATDQFEAW